MDVTRPPDTDVAELLAEVDRQAAEITALRLLVRVRGEHYRALGVEVGVEHIEADAAARGLPNWRGTFSEMAHAFGAERSAISYANVAAEHVRVSALDALEALAKLARADGEEGIGGPQGRVDTAAGRFASMREPPEGRRVSVDQFEEVELEDPAGRGACCINYSSGVPRLFARLAPPEVVDFTLALWRARPRGRGVFENPED